MIRVSLRSIVEASLVLLRMSSSHVLGGLSSVRVCEKVNSYHSGDG